MKTIKSIHYLLGIVCLTLFLQACSTSPKSLSPIASENQQNIADLSENVNALLSLYEPLLNVSGNAIIYQQLDKLQQELIALVGTAIMPAPAANETWDIVFQKAVSQPLAKREKYLERYRFIQSALARGLDTEEQQVLKYKEGWIYLAATEPTFTPQKAHELLRQVADLKSADKDKPASLQKIEELLLPYDPILEKNKQTIASAQLLFSGLKKNVESQLNMAASHGEAITDFSETSNKDGLGSTVKNTVKSLVPNVDKAKLEATLNKYSEKYLNNPSYKDAAVDLLIKGLTTFISSKYQLK